MLEPTASGSAGCGPSPRRAVSISPLARCTMRVKATLRFILVIGALCIATAIPAARAQQTPPNVNPTHYWTYHLNQPYPNPQPVAVMDQFLPQFVPNTTDQMERLVNWVKKIDPSRVASPVLDPNLHY